MEITIICLLHLLSPGMPSKPLIKMKQFSIMLTSVRFLASLVVYALSCALWDLSIPHKPLIPIETISSVGFEKPNEEMVFGRCAVYKEHTLSNVLADGTLHQERWRIIQEPRDCLASGYLSVQEPIYKSCNLCYPSNWPNEKKALIGVAAKNYIWSQNAFSKYWPIVDVTSFDQWSELKLPVKRNPHIRAPLHLICDRKSGRGSWKELF